MKHEPDRYCVTTPDGDCVSTDPRCMHQVTESLSTQCPGCDPAPGGSKCGYHEVPGDVGEDEPGLCNHGDVLGECPRCG